MAEQKSLREQILEASNEVEIGGLLSAGLEYEGASPRTQARWRSAAKKRRAQLGAVK